MLKMSLLRRSGIGVCHTANAIGWRPDTVAQVGVGGYHKEVEVMKDEWPDVRIIGFDPLPGIDDYDGELHPIAISDYCGKGTFHHKRRHPDGSSLCLIPDQPDAPGREVQVTTLDSAIPYDDLGHILLWLDCEGSEMPALRGGERLIEHVEMVNVELSFRDSDAVAIHDWLAAHGYFRQWIHTHRPASGQCDGVYVRRHLFRPEFACDPWEITRYRKECPDA